MRSFAQLFISQMSICFSKLSILWERGNLCSIGRELHFHTPLSTGAYLLLLDFTGIMWSEVFLPTWAKGIWVYLRHVYRHQNWSLARDWIQTSLQLICTWLTYNNADGIYKFSDIGGRTHTVPKCIELGKYRNQIKTWWFMLLAYEIY